MIEQETDEAIAARVQDGNKEAFGVLVERYEAKLLRYARRFVRDSDDMMDMVQDVFIKAYVNIRSFRTSERFSPWLYRIAHNEYVNALKKRRMIPFSFFEMDADAFLPFLAAPERSDKQADERILHEALEKCLGDLDTKYREVLVLSYLQELSYEEISDILRIPVSTVGVRINRAKSKLKEIYNSRYPAKG